MFQVYLVESDSHLNHLLSLYLQKEGWTVTSFLEGEKASKYVDRCPHIWIVDSRLSDIDGYQVLNEIKAKYQRIPVILMSERNTGMDRVIGLEMGCDDYLSKPFLPRELVIRTKKILERTYSRDLKVDKSVSIRISPYTIYEMKRIVMYKKDIVNLTSKEFDMLLLFVKNPMTTLSREQILKHVWGINHFGSDRAVDDLVRRLRRKMKFLRIETVYGYGYRLLQSLNTEQGQKAL